MTASLQRNWSKLVLKVVGGIAVLIGTGCLPAANGKGGNPGPLPMYGPAIPSCESDADCEQKFGEGYVCSEYQRCTLAPDAGTPDAGQPDGGATGP